MRPPRRAGDSLGQGRPSACPQVVGDRYPESQMAMTFHYGNQQQQQA